MYSFHVPLEVLSDALSQDKRTFASLIKLSGVLCVTAEKKPGSQCVINIQSESRSVLLALMHSFLKMNEYEVPIWIGFAGDEDLQKGEQDRLSMTQAMNMFSNAVSNMLSLNQEQQFPKRRIVFVASLKVAYFQVIVS